MKKNPYGQDLWVEIRLGEDDNFCHCCLDFRDIHLDPDKREIWQSNMLDWERCASSSTILTIRVAIIVGGYFIVHDGHLLLPYLWKHPIPCPPLSHKLNLRRVYGGDQYFHPT